MSEDFPLTVEMLLSVLEVIAPQFKHFQKLRDFIEMKLPPGFPVKVDIPVLPTVSARVTFHDFAWKNVNREDEFTATDSSNEQQAEGIVDSSNNEALTKGAKSNGNTKNKVNKEDDTGSSHNLAKKEMSKSSNNSDDDDDTVSEESTHSRLDDSLFEIPAGYVEDNTRFPDL
jgi:type IV secretory pathway VirB10-like protein